MLAEGEEIALVDPTNDDEIMATMTLTEKYEIDKDYECEKIFTTTDPDHPGAHAALGGLYREQRRLDEATNHLRQALAGNPGDSRSAGQLLEILARGGRVPEATALLAQMKRFDEATRHLERAYRLAPTDPAVLFSLGTALAQQGDTSRAIPILGESLRHDPRNADARSNLGRALLAVGRVDEARTQFVAALEIAPDHPQARQGLARCNER